MGVAVALPAVASLLLAATVEPAVSLRVEGRGAYSAPEGRAATSRAAASTIPQASVAIEGAPLRFQAGYAATLWTSDVGAHPSALVNHAVEARLEARPAGLWRAAAAASALRGETDPLASAPTAGAGASQLASTGPIPFQNLRAEVRAERQLDLRSTASASGRWSDTRVLRGDLRSLLPPQRGAGTSAGLSHRLSERDALAGGASADWSETRLAAGITTGVAIAADATWRRALTPVLDGWARAGAGLLYTDEPAVASRRDVLPTAGAGVARRPGAGGVGAELSANFTSAVDRFRGDVRPVVDGRIATTWAAAERVTLSGQASASRRLDGDTTVAASDLRVAWVVRPQSFAVEAGVLWRLQRERRPELPSFSEAGGFVGLQYLAGRR